ESTVWEMKTLGVAASLIAVCGILGSSAAAWAVARWQLPASTPFAHVFIGASLAATSVGVTARALRDLGHARSATAHLILAAAVVVVVAWCSQVFVGRRGSTLGRLVGPLASWLVAVFCVVVGLRAGRSGLAGAGVVAFAAVKPAANASAPGLASPDRSVRRQA